MMGLHSQNATQEAKQKGSKMKFSKTVKTAITATVIAVGANQLNADVVTLDFEAVPASQGSWADPTLYLKSFGITVSNVTPSALFGVTVSDAEIPSTKHVLNEYNGSNSESFTLNFSDPVASLSFIRQQYGSNNSGPAWQASTLDSLGRVIGTVSEGAQFASASAAFTLVGNDIKALRIDSYNTGQQTWSGPPIGSLTITSTPEPATFLPALAFIVMGIIWRRGRFQK